MKWRLMTSRLRSMTGLKRAGAIIGLVGLAALLGVVVWALATLRQVPQIGYLVASGVFVGQLVAWMITPLVAFGVDETVDPQRFALLPLRVGQLQRGLLASALIGPLPIANFITLVGLAIGLSFRGWMLPIALLCAILQLLTCVVFSRAAAAAMASLMSSRRGRDLGVLVGFCLVVAYMAVNLVLNSANQAGFGSAAGSVASVLTWTPPGALATLPMLIAAGNWTRVIVAVVTVGVFLALGWLWWSRTLRRSLTTIDSTTSGSAPARGLLGGQAVAGSVSGTARVVGSRDLTLIWRDPMRRMPWLLSLFLAIGWPLLVFRGAAMAPLGCALGALTLGAQAANFHGVEGSGLWLHVVSFADRVRARGEVWGHMLASVLPGAVVTVIGVVVVAIVADSLALIPAAIAVSWSALVGACSAAAILSAYKPYAMPQSRKSMFASSAPGQKLSTFIVTLSVMLGGAVAAVPAGAMAIAQLRTGHTWWGWLAVLFTLLCAPLLMSLASRLAADRFLATAPETLAVVSVGDRS